MVRTRGVASLTAPSILLAACLHGTAVAQAAQPADSTSPTTDASSQIMRLSAELDAKAESLEAGLFARLQVAKLHHGHLRMPPTTTHVIMEVGCSDFQTLDVTMNDRSPSAFLISFEPLLDKYSTLLARGNERFHGANARDASTPLGHNHQRAVVLPMALSPQGGPVNISVSKVAGCSSIRPLRSLQEAAKAKVPWCGGQAVEQRTVLSLSLGTALGLAGKLPVSWLKLDAQGLDLALFNTLSPGWGASVLSIEMEVRSAKCPQLYTGAADCDQVVSFFRAAGFTEVGKCPVGLNGGSHARCNNPKMRGIVGDYLCCESDMTFCNNNLRGRAPGASGEVAPLCNGTRF
jgi:hypothetical protein